MRYIHYLGLAFAVFMLVSARRSAQETDQTLSHSAYKQQNLRSILWVNLLIQRSTSLALTANQVKDLSYLDRAKTIADSLERPISNIGANARFEPLTDMRTVVQQNGIEFRESLAKYLARQADSSQLSADVDRIGAKLNQLESEEWYKLNEQNTLLLSNIHQDHVKLMFMLGIFVAYLALLGWILKQKEKAESALRDAEAKMLNSAKISALGEMAGGVAHEINNPLATISLLNEQVIEVLQEKAADNSLALEMLQKVTKTVARISAIVQGLRTFSRDGSQDPFVATQVSEIVASTLALCQEKFKNSGIQVTVTIEPENLSLKCRRVQLSQVLLNLFNNSCDAIGNLPEKWIKISATAHAGTLKLAVTDSGAGIPEAVSQKIFNPFFTTKEIGKGTGLGLSISKGIVDAHQGKISVDRTCPNTRLVLELPLLDSKGEKIVA